MGGQASERIVNVHQQAQRTGLRAGGNDGQYSNWKNPHPLPTPEKDEKPGDIADGQRGQVMIHDIFIPFVSDEFEEIRATKLWDRIKSFPIYDHLVPASQVDDTRHLCHIGDEFAKYGENVRRKRRNLPSVNDHRMQVGKTRRRCFRPTAIRRHTAVCVLFGISYTEMASILEQILMLDQSAGETIKVVIEGEAAENVMSKDIIRRLIGDLGAERRNLPRTGVLGKHP